MTLSLYHTSLLFMLLFTTTCLSLPQASRRSTWTSLGCYTDNVSGRALSIGLQVPGGTNAMTNAICQSTCLAAGFSLAGTEYAGECWCGDSVINGGGPAPDGNTGCDMACKGDASEMCGGPNRLDLWQYRSGSTPTSTIAAPPPISTVTPTPSSVVPALPPSPCTPVSGKRGLVYNNNNPGANAEYANLFATYNKISWGYDYGYLSLGLNTAWEFIPQLWGLPTSPQPSWTAAVELPGIKSVLAFNEPDLTYSSSANILPELAAAGYKEFMEPFSPQVKIGIPNILWNNDDSYSSGGPYDSRVWTSYFIGNCTGCHFDFAAIHYYQDCFPADGQSGVAWFQGNVTNAYETLNLPIWITEFMCYGTEAQQISFLQEVLPWLDSQTYVEKYSYFGVFPGYLLNAGGTALSNLGTAYATT